jgi:hypothetical protein
VAAQHDMASGGSLLPSWYDCPLVPIRRAFDKLKEVRQLEYELDFAQNRARRDLTALQAKLDAMTARYADFACGTWHWSFLPAAAIDISRATK